MGDIMASSYYESQGMTTNYILSEDKKIVDTYFKTSTVVIQEVPVGAKPFTTKFVDEKSTTDQKENSIVYIMAKDINDEIYAFDSSFVTVTKRLLVYFGRVKFNLCGFYLVGENAKKYGVKDGTIYISDIYINSNFIDFPLLTKIVKNAGLNLLPVINLTKFSEAAIKEAMGTFSLIKNDLVVEKVLIKRKIEFAESGVTSYTRASIYAPSNIKEEEEIKEEEPNLPLLPPAEDFDISKRERELDKIIEELNGEAAKNKVTKEVEIEVVEEEKGTEKIIENLFYFYAEPNKIVESLAGKNIKIVRDNFYLILTFIKGSFIHYMLGDKDFGHLLQEDKFQKIDKQLGILARNFMKENLNL